MGNQQANRFFIVNAAIKNTCFIDPKKENCPHTLKEISYIEPKPYQESMKSGQDRYIYYPETNLYTLVVRYSPVRAVVLDWRLVETTQLDFREYDVEVLGKDRLEETPPFAGPWEFEEWKY